MQQRPGRILIVDDDTGVTAFLADVLGYQGYVTKTAGNGIEMRSALASQRFDLAIVDALLPRESGLALAAEASAFGAQILMMTGDQSTLSGVVGLKFGILQKPFLEDTVLRSVGQILKSKGSLSPSSGRLRGA